MPEQAGRAQTGRAGGRRGAQMHRVQKGMPGKRRMQSARNEICMMEYADDGNDGSMQGWTTATARDRATGGSDNARDGKGARQGGGRAKCSCNVG